MRFLTTTIVNIQIVFATVFHTTLDRYNHPRFLAEYILEDGNVPVPGFVSIDVFRESPDAFLANFSNVGVMRQIETIRGFRLGNIDFLPGGTMGALDASYRRYDPTVVTAAGPDSFFASQVQGFVVAPVSPTEGVLVINPPNPSQYAYEGEMFYTPLVPTPDHMRIHRSAGYWTVDAVVRFVDDEIDVSTPVFEAVSRYHACAIGDFSQYFRLPGNFVTSFLNMLISRGIRYERRDQHIESNLIRLYDITEETVLSLPWIQFVSRTDQGVEFAIFELGPHEYARPATNLQPNTWELLIIELFDRPDHCTINQYIVNKLAIHYDVANQRIGFGEPLNEI